MSRDSRNQPRYMHLNHVCLLVGFSGEFRHRFYTQKEDPGIGFF